MKTAKNRLKNWSLLNKILFNLNKYKFFLVLVSLFFSKTNVGQIANYISNGGFEIRYTCSPPFVTTIAKNWMSIDSNNSVSGAYYTTCNGTIPYPNGGFQYPRNGNSLIGGTWYCDPSFCLNLSRAYPKNRLKANLVGGKVYCVKFYVNITNQSPYGMDGYGAYFGDNTIDTITQCTIPLTYLAPQVQNPTGNIITDTLNWTLITGTFVANGTEKYCLLGNFKSHLATNAVTINPAYLPQQWTDVLIDDVSCIPIDLPAYAGPDVWAIPGNTVYIGRPQDVGIDEACTWYNLTNTTTPVANAAGFSLTVSAITATYMVRQDICGIIKYDTVVVHASALGLNELKIKDEGLKIYPNPTNDKLNIQFTINDLDKEFTKAEIINSIGQLVKVVELSYTNNTTQINTNELPIGVYHLLIKSKNQSINKRFVIAR